MIEPIDIATCEMIAATESSLAQEDKDAITSILKSRENLLDLLKAATRFEWGLEDQTVSLECVGDKILAQVNLAPLEIWVIRCDGDYWNGGDWQREQYLWSENAAFAEILELIKKWESHFKE